MNFKKKKDLVILCGGTGSRLGSITQKIPKPLLKFNNKPFLEILIQKYQKYNFENIFLLACYKGYLFKKYHNKYFNLTKCSLVVEKERKGTGGALYDLKKKVKNNFLLVNGDSIFEADLKNFFNLNKEKICKMILIKNTNYKENNKLNNLSINKNNDVIISKKNFFMNSGIYFFSKNIFNYIDNKFISLEDEIIPKLIKSKKITGLKKKR